MRLSPRHIDIIVAVARDGLSYPAAAEQLGIAPATVRHHIKIITERARQAGVLAPPRDVLIHLFYNEILPPSPD